MGKGGRFTRGRGSPYLLGGLVLACLAVFLLAREGQNRALTDQVDGAVSRTQTYAAAVFGAGLTADSASPVAGVAIRDLYTGIRAEIFTDHTTARVRLYDAGGTLVYDTDVLRQADLVPVANPNVDRSLQGETYALVVQQPFTWSTIGTSGTLTSLLEVYTPLKLADRVAPEGVVEVDYFMDQLRTDAKGVWPVVQLVVGAILLLCLAMTVLSLRRSSPPVAEMEPALLAAPVDARDASPVAPTEDPRVGELTEKIAALEQAVHRSEDSQAELETVRAREAALEARLNEIERQMHAPAPAVEPEAPVTAPPTPAAAQEDHAVVEGSDLSDAEVNELRARLTRAAARKRPSPGV